LGPPQCTRDPPAFTFMKTEPTLDDYWRILARHWRLMSFAPLLAGVVSAAATLTVVPRAYRADATLLISQGGAQQSLLNAFASALPMPLAGAGVSPGAIMTYRAILESRAVRVRLAKDLDLRRQFQTATEDGAVNALRQATTVTVDSPSSVLTIRVSIQGTPRWCRKRTWGTNDIRARKLAADIANGYRRYLEQYLRGNAVFQAQRNRKFLAEQVAAAKAELTKAETVLLAYQEARGIVSLPDEMKAVLQQHGELAAQKTAAELDLKQKSDQLAALRERLLSQAKAGITESLPDVRPVVDQSRTRLAELEVELSVKSESLAPSNPEIRELRRRIDETRVSLKEQLDRVFGTVEKGLVTDLVDLEVENAVSRAKVEGLKYALSRTARRLEAMPANLVGVGRLQRNVEVKQKVYELLCIEHERARIEEVREVTEFEMLDSATVPAKHYAPQLKVNVPAAFGGAFLLAAVFVWCRDPRVARGTPS